jgi:uncharacterized protein (TIGR03000 family)
MSSCVLSRRRLAWAWAALLLTGSPAWSQSAGYPYPYSGYPYPLTGSSISLSSAPYWGTVPSYYGGAPLPYQENGVSLKPVTSYLYSPGTFVPNYLGSESSAASVLNNPGILWPSSQPAARLDKRAHIWLRVPADAEVWFDGAKTKQTGTMRHFFSPTLEVGKSYSYQVRVRWQKDGKPVERKRQIDVRAGDSLQVDFN